MKLTKKLFIAIMTMALLVVTFSASTFAWFTLGETSKIEDIQVKVKSSKGMELSLDGKKWTNNISLDASGVEFADLTTADGKTIVDMKGDTVKNNLTAANNETAVYFEKTIYVRITTTTTTGENPTTSKDFTKVVLNAVYGSEKTFGAGTDASHENQWLADATLKNGNDNKEYTPVQVGTTTLAAKTIVENQYRSFDPLNAVKISFATTRNNAEAVTGLYGYESVQNFGTVSTTGLAKDYADAKDYDITSTISPATYTSYTEITAPTSPSTLTKYNAKIEGTSDPRLVVLEASDFGAFSTLGDLGVTNADDTNYVYAKLTIRIWLDGWDADCINAILEKETELAFELKAE